MLFQRHTILPFLCGIQMMLATGALGADVQAKIEQLNQREKQLIEKLEDIRQRERYVESQLEEVRRRKQALLNKQGGNLPVKVPGATAAPTPAP
jgi:TolA-binding protein